MKKKEKEGRHFKNASAFLEERLGFDKSISTPQELSMSLWIIKLNV
jgi:hypothetical protein